ncbi:MAG: cytochrome c biogenesis protein CcmG/thiol:disulfide interchange protein DsbE [Saprospiraceae bacterium]|jgi:cytochrome c biogenesis protein CcmG/thiol:disulfide interchange protein DsbE
MKKITFILLILSVFACSSTTENKADIAKAVVVSQATKPVPVQRDTIKPPPKRNNTYVMSDPSRPAGEINKAFPFDIPLKGADEKIYNSSELLKNNGKPTVVLFWLTTCYPCRIEMAAIQKELDAWKAETEFNIIAISTDFEKNYGNFVKMVNDSNWSFDAYVDVNREFYKVMPGELNGLPQSFIFDKKGEIAYHSRKYSSGDEHKLYAKIKELAAK